MVSRQQQIADIVEPVADAITNLIGAAVKANPQHPPTAIIMTILDVSTSSSILGVQKAYLTKLTLGQIIETHFEHVVDIVAIMEAAKREEERHRDG